MEAMLRGKQVLTIIQTVLVVDLGLLTEQKTMALHQLACLIQRHSENKQARMKFHTLTPMANHV